jgi:hypothetical protein
MVKKKRMVPKNKKTTEVWTEEQYEEYMAGLYGLEYVAGFTEGGVPYGVSIDDNEQENFSDSEDLPF